MSRSRSSNSVSLFPFLAVLVCAMGSLIFLLIVTTQQIRSDAVEKAIAKRKAKKALEDQDRSQVVRPALPVYVPSSPGLPESYVTGSGRPQVPERMEPIPGVVELGIARSTPVLPPPKVVPPPPEPKPIWPSAIAQKPAPLDPNIQLREELGELQKARQARLEAVRQKGQDLARLKQQLDTLTENLKRINTQIEETAKDRLANREEQRKLLEAQNSLLGQLAKVDKQIEQAKQQAAFAPTKFQVVPFDGLTGTNYRPIIIECTAAGMRFVPEDVLITESDFDGFTLGKNPLLSGAKALSDYWMKASVRSDGKEPMPYVLLIVRPSGARLYAARLMLEALDRPFGYELVEENLPLDLPPKDPVAAQLCREAVEETLKDRNDLKKLLATHGPEILNRNPNYRVIRKPGGGFEVEYAPDGKFRESEFGGNGNSPLFGDRNDGPLGQPAQPRDPNNSGRNGRPGEPGGIGVPPAPSESPLPPFAGNSTGTGNRGTQDSGLASTQDRSRGPMGTESNPGGVGYDPNAPRLLPEEILRRSQGRVPYRENGGSFTDSRLTGTPGGFGTEEHGMSEGTVEGGQPGTREQGMRDAIGEGGQPGAANPDQIGNLNHNGQFGQPNDYQNQIPRVGSSDGTNSTQLPSAGGTSSNPSIVTGSAPSIQPLDSFHSQTPSGQMPPQGMAGMGSGSPVPPGIPSSLYEQAMPNFSRRMINRIQPYQRRWGLSDPRASIGFEREIIVRVEPNRLVVGNAFAVNYDLRATKEQLGASLLEAIELTVRTWGRPPMSFYWVPTIKFQVGNDQIPIYRHLTATAKVWGLETSAEGIAY